MDKAVALQLARRCLPLFESKGLASVGEIEGVRPRNLLGLWTGMGSVDEIEVTGKTATETIVVKSIGSYKKLDDELALVDHMSYYNEASFYESDLADRICDSGARCPRAFLVDRSKDGEVTICMTKLPGRGFSRSPTQTKAALSWLARLHSCFWGKRADEAMARSGLSGQACFWHLDTRQIELKSMPQDALRWAAKGIDARLKADRMQTLCHGDPKGANIMWDDEAGVFFYDFQWFGKAPPTKDLAYFFGVAAPGLSSEESERELLRFYHGELSKLLEAQEDAVPDFEYLWNSYHLALCDLGRWMKGGFSFGNTRLIFGHVQALLKSLEGLKEKSEEMYQDKIFELYPP